jgi:hypothetical protein
MRCPDCGFELNKSGKCDNCTTILTSSIPTDTKENKKLIDYDNFSFRKFTGKAEISKTIHTLEGLVSGIQLDGQISNTEINELKYWCLNHEQLIKVAPFTELIPLIRKSLEDNILGDEEIKDILWVCNNFKYENQYYDIITSDIQRLHGIIHGIMADNEITKEELLHLQDWLDENEHLASTYPYDELSSLLLTVLADGIISTDELNILKTFFSDFIDTDYSSSINTEELKQLKKEYSIIGVCAIDPNISFDNKTFCFTGASSKTSRKAFADTINSIGCNYKDGISAKVDYLIIGNEGNPCWAFSCYGRKVEAAVKLRKDGHPILLIHENDFWDAYLDKESSILKEAK